MRWLAFALFVCSLGEAQSPTATLEGQVLDATGSAIVNAEVRAIQASTGNTQTQLTGPAGSFHFPFLPVGRHDLRVSAANFAPHVQGPITLTINQTARLTIQLQLAKSAETINVSAQALLVDTGSNVIGNVVTGRQLVELPLNGRNFTQLGLLQPGVAPLTAGSRQGRRFAARRAGLRGKRPASGIQQLPARRRDAT